MSTVAAAPIRWHQLSATDARERLGSRETGLTAEEVAARQAEHGPNALQASPPLSAWRILLDQLKSVVVALLFAAAILAFVMSSCPVTSSSSKRAWPCRRTRGCWRPRSCA